MKEKTLGSNPGEYNLWGYFFFYSGEWPTPAKTTVKSENRSKEGPINTTVGKSGTTLLFITHLTLHPRDLRDT